MCCWGRVYGRPGFRIAPGIEEHASMEINHGIKAALPPMRLCVDKFLKKGNPHPYLEAMSTHLSGALVIPRCGCGRLKSFLNGCSQ